jgi:guanylate kinase
MTGKGLLLPIAAPSGTGKTTVCRQLMAHDDRMLFSVSATTRPPRNYEQEGVDYFFLNRVQFEQYIRDGLLVEWEEVFGNYYGTLKSYVEQALTTSKILLLDIDVKGALEIKKLYPENALTIFLMPPNQAELLRRLKGRSTDDERNIALRNARIPEEIELSRRFDYQIINDKLNKTIQKISNVIEEYWQK